MSVCEYACMMLVGMHGFPWIGGTSPSLVRRSRGGEGPTSPRQSQISKSIELSKLKIRNTASVSASVPNSLAKGARIVEVFTAVGMDLEI